jgi:hypothetical protein
LEKAMNDTTAPSGITRYRNKQIAVETIQFLGEENCEQVHTFLGIEHSDAPCSNLIDINSYGLVQSAAAGDWIVHNANGAYLAFADEEFHEEFEPEDDEPELGWDETVVHHPRIGMLRIPLNHGDNDAGVLVLDNDAARKLAATILNMLAENNPNPFTWGEGIAADLHAGTIDIPVEHGDVPIGSMRLPLKNGAVLRDMLDAAVAEAQQMKTAAGRAADHA